MGVKSLAAASLPVTRNLLACPRWPALHPRNPPMSVPATASAFNKDHPFMAKVTENRLLNKAGSAKETRHFIVDTTGSGMHYKAGDSLGIFPSNRPSDVQEILRLLHATGIELVSPVMLKLATPIT